ncbi:MAG: inosine/xanthosine triphosphatase [Candidatus Nanohaloarchaea archaeon]|nr:inosine/xanthosine triphosphatase [Candidatus Nanohaloarchaea archaeon]
MRLGVGSTNPVKSRAVEEAGEELFGAVEVERLDVDSGVSEMPTSWDEGVEGAYNRANSAMESGDYSLAFGLEGYTIDTERGMFLSNWCVILDPEGTRGDGGGATVRLPDTVADRIRDGEELGPVMDEELDREDVNEKEGTIGVLTGGRITRQEAFEDSIFMSLADLEPGIGEGDME